MASRPAEGGPSVEGGHAKGRGRPVRILRVVLWALLAGVVLLAALVLLSIPAVLGVREHLDDGRRAMERARSAVVAGDAEGALTSFRAARSSFGDAEAQARTVVLRILSVLPGAGSNVDAVRSLAEAGDETARAGIEVSEAVSELPGGIEGLAPVDGRIPLERFPPLAEAVRRAHALVLEGLRDVRSTAGSMFLLPQVEDARRLAETALDDLERTLGASAVTLERLPAFLGSDDVRTYLLGAENPAELRGTGGLIGAYSLLRAADGRLSLSSFRPVQSLPSLDPDSLEPPSADYHRLYDPQRQGEGFWLNVNMTPDFPSAARAMETAFESATGRTIDGVITADPFALRALMQATGPARVPELGVSVTAETVVSFLANRAYAEIDDPTQRKLVLGAVAGRVFERFLSAAGEAQAVRAVTAAAGEGHVKVYVDDPELQRALAETGAGGAFPQPEDAPGDLLSVVINNGAGNKVDYYVGREIGYAITLHDDGTASAVAEVRLTNRAPERGQPRYVLGPNRGVTDRPGQDVSIMNVYCRLCRLSSATRNGRAFDPGTDHELSSNFLQDYVTIDPGTTTRDRFAYRLPRAWIGDSSGGTYTLRFVNQSTIEPTVLDVRVRIPEGMHVTDASEGVEVHGSTATWSGTPSRTLVIELSFAPPLPQRLWRDLIG